MPITAQSAETLALNVLGWLVGNDELLPIFLGSTGASADDLRARVGETGKHTPSHPHTDCVKTAGLARL